MNKIALHINEILVVPEQEWWKFEARIARLFERWIVFQMRLSSKWQARIHGCHGSTVILDDGFPTNKAPSAPTGDIESNENR